MISGVSSSIAAVQSVAGAHNRSSSAQEAPGRADPTHLSEEQQQQVARLKERDREVRAHEQAHSRAGGPYAGAPSYEFERGPDGHMYAVSGEVRIDSAPIDGNPEATIAKMETVIRAALSPQDPSAQDSRVAAQARGGQGRSASGTAKTKSGRSKRYGRRRQVCRRNRTRSGRRSVRKYRKSYLVGDGVRAKRCRMTWCAVEVR